MVRTIRLGLFVLLVFALFASFFLSARPAAAAECPAGTRPLAENEVQGMPAGTCFGDQDKKLLYGGCDGDPYTYLEQRHAGDRSNSFIRPQQTGGGGLKNGLNPALACRLKKFMEFAESPRIGCPIKISSAMRPVQRCNPNGGACAQQGRSCHQYGLAVDVTTNQRCLDWILQTLGRKNPNSPFGIHSAYPERPGYRHLQCTENLVASCSSETKGCGGAANISPDLSNIPGPSSFPGENRLRSLLQPPPPPPQQTQSTSPAATQPTLQSTQNQPALGTNNQTSYSAGTCSPQFYCANSTYYYRTSTCVDQVYQRCELGCASTGICATATSSTSTPQTTGGDAATSTYDLIGGYAGLTQATTTPAPKEIPINPETTQATVLVPQRTPQGIVYVPASGQGQATQTFTSSDLSGAVPAFAQPASGFQATLNSLKQTITALLRYLRPFGGTTQIHEQAD